MQRAAVRDTIEVAVDPSRAPTPNTARLMTIVRRRRGDHDGHAHDVDELDQAERRHSAPDLS
jgi:hypothetical protein